MPSDLPMVVVVGELPEAAVVSDWGGRTVVLPYLPGRSTTGILARGA